MRTLLINSNRFKQPWPVIPFGVGCVAAAVEQAGHAVRVLDLCFATDPGRDIRQAVDAFSPDVLGVSIRNIDNSAGYNPLFLLAVTRRDVIEPCKQAFSGPIVIGGPAVGINGAEMLEYFDLPYAIRGDGEAAMVAFLRRMEQHSPLEGMAGLVRRVDGRIVEDNGPMPVDDLDALPMDRVYDHIDLAPYRGYGAWLQVQTKRGCALSCTYCTYNRIEGRRWRLRDPERVADDIERLVEKTGIPRVEFTDSTFNYPLDHCKAVLHALAKKGLKIQLRTMGLNPGAVDEELVDLMSRAGFREVDLGAESLCDRTLHGLGKNYGTADVVNAARLLREKKIAVMWYLLLGGPGETAETVRETLDAVKEEAAPWDLVNVGIGLRIYKGAPIAEQALGKNASDAQGLLQPVTYEPENLGMKHLKVLVKQEALRRPNMFMYDEDEAPPLIVQKIGGRLLKILAPGRPLWVLFIITRRVQTWLGIRMIQRVLFNITHARTLVDLHGGAAEPISRERIGNFLAGSFVLSTVGLGYFHSPYWLLATAGIACNLFVTSILNRCAVKALLVRMGLPGEWDLGGITALRDLKASAPGAPAAEAYTTAERHDPSWKDSDPECPSIDDRSLPTGVNSGAPLSGQQELARARIWG